MITDIKPAMNILNRIARRNGKATMRELQTLESLRAQIYVNVMTLDTSFRGAR